MRDKLLFKLFGGTLPRLFNMLPMSEWECGKANRFVIISLYLGVEILFSDALLDILIILLLLRDLFIERDFI